MRHLWAQRHDQAAAAAPALSEPERGSRARAEQADSLGCRQRLCVSKVPESDVCGHASWRCSLLLHFAARRAVLRAARSSARSPTPVPEAAEAAAVLHEKHPLVQFGLLVHEEARVTTTAEAPRRKKRC